MSQNEPSTQNTVDTSEAVVSLWNPPSREFESLVFPQLTRKGATANEYLVYSDSTNFKTVEAQTAMMAIASSEIVEPFKVVHAFCRMDTLFDLQTLETGNMVTVDVGKEAYSAYLNELSDFAESAQETTPNPEPALKAPEIEDSTVSDSDEAPS